MIIHYVIGWLYGRDIAVVDAHSSLDASIILLRQPIPPGPGETPECAPSQAVPLRRHQYKRTQKVDCPPRREKSQT